MRVEVDVDDDALVDGDEELLHRALFNLVLNAVQATPDARTAIRISPGPACGSGSSPTRRTSAGPYSWKCSALMAADVNRNTPSTWLK